MDSAVTTGAFTLGGVIIGGTLDWVRAWIAARRAKAGQRDELIAALDAACVRYMSEARTWRALDTPQSKARQLGFGMLEAGMPDWPDSVVGGIYVLIKWLGEGTAKRMGHQTPVALTDALRSTIMPLQSEIAAMAVRLSMLGDEGIKDAAGRMGDAVGALVDQIARPAGEYAAAEEEIQAAIGQLRRARDAANAPWWRRRKLRARIKPAASTQRKALPPPA